MARGDVAAAALALAIRTAAAESSFAQEIAPFRLLGVDGYVNSRYLSDRYVTDSAGTGRAQQAQSDVRQELVLTTHSYVYHPNLLLLDIGGGPIFQEGRYETQTGEARARSTLYNFSARATVLRDKPYRGSLFYEHLNPTLNIGPGQVMSQESSRYGFDAALLQPASPVPLAAEATRSRYQGSGADHVIDDKLDQFSLRGSYSFANLGSTQVRFSETKQESASGSISLPILAATSSSRELSADTRLTFGAEREYEVMNLVTLGSQDYTVSQGTVPARKDLRALLNVRGRHGRDLQSYANLSHSRGEQGLYESRLDTAMAGFTYRVDPDLGMAGSLRADNSRTTQSTARTMAADGSANYRRALALGTMQASYAVTFTARDQEASAPQTNVVGERLTLVGTTPAALLNPRAIVGSIAISNSTRTQTYVQGFDYVVSVLGQQVRVQRLVGGSILDGQEVLADYAYDVGGTFSYHQIDQSAGLGWNVSRYFDVYYRFVDSSPRLVSGAPTAPLNVVRDHVIGARFEIPWKRGLELTLGGGLEYENRRETIAPYRRTSSDAYVESVEPLFGTGNARFTMRRNRVDYETSVLDVDWTGYDFTLWTRHPLGIELGANASYEKDSGSVVLRTRTAASVKAQWRYRRVSLTADLGHANESQGSLTRRRTLLQFFLRREFGG